MSTQLQVVKEQTVDTIARRVNQLQQVGEINLPANYSAANALKSAWLILQDVADKDGKLALETCTRESITNALFDMVIQGLNPAKKQCYFIAFGKKLVLMRSYFGSMAVAKMLDPSIEDIVAEVVYEGDEFAYEIRRGKKQVTKHEQKLGNVNGQLVLGAYAEVIGRDGAVKRTEIMSYQEILQSWKQSRRSPFDQAGKLKSDTTHAKFAGEMAKRTVINKVCKPIINSSSDSEILNTAINRAYDEMAEAEVQHEIEQNANRDAIDIEPEPEPQALHEPEPLAQTGTASPDF